MALNYWGLSEIVRVIAANLVSDNAIASAVAFASCSKSLREPALDEVWRSLSSLTPLVKCFPPQVWELKEDRLYFQRAPLCKEWTQFQEQYASRVRHLKIRSEDIHTSLAALHMLQHLSGFTALLPNLVSLGWDSDEEFLPWVSLFISQSLASIDIKTPAGASHVLPPILRRLLTISPCIRDIRVLVKELQMHNPSMMEVSSQLLMKCNTNRLRNYIVSALTSTSALRRAIQLPSLESFWLVFESSRCQLPDPLPVVVFPNLQTLFVSHEGGEHTWLDLLPAIENPVLSMISISCLGPGAVQFMVTFKSIVIRCRPDMHERLKVFKLRSGEEFKIAPHDISCFIPFKNLKSLDISGKCSDVCQTSELADGDIDLLTKALPCLEHLKLGGSPCSVPSKITFKSLYTISHRCTHLKTLRIHFNPTSLISTVANAEVRDFALGPSELCSATWIDVGEILLPEESGTFYAVLALGLVGIFPHLENISNLNGALNGHWKDIYDMIQNFRRMGRFGFGPGLFPQ